MVDTTETVPNGPCVSFNYIQVGKGVEVEQIRKIIKGPGTYAEKAGKIEALFTEANMACRFMTPPKYDGVNDHRAFTLVIHSPGKFWDSPKTIWKFDHDGNGFWHTTIEQKLSDKVPTQSDYDNLLRGR